MTLDDEKAIGHVALKGFFGICREWGELLSNLVYDHQAASLPD